MGWQYPPEMCQWDITSRCNLKCKHCRATTSWKKSKDIKTSVVLYILDQLFSFAPDVHLALAGGEPLLRSDLKEILTHVKRKFPNAPIELLTNGTLITQRNIGWLSDLIDGFNIGLEGASEEVNDAIRGKGSFKRAIRGISLLVRRGLNPTVRMTFFHQEESEVERLMKFLKKIGVNSFNFRYFVPVGRARNKALSAQQYKRLAEKVWETGRSLGLRIGFSDPFPEILVNEKRRKEIEQDKELRKGIAVTGCSIGFNLLYLDPRAIVKACPYFPVVLDDAKKRPLKDIWFFNPTMERIRWIRGNLTGKCGKCKYRFACGGCRGAAFSNGDFLGEDPRCWY